LEAQFQEKIGKLEKRTRKFWPIWFYNSRSS
jgi:hypothetical protein